MKRHFYSIIPLTFTLLTSFVPAYAESPMVYKDLQQASSWAKESIVLLNQMGISNGYPDQSYHPQASITRREVAVMVCRALKLDTNANANSTFTDVSGSDWAERYIAAVHAQGLMNGGPNHAFRPDDNITREELAAILSQVTLSRPKENNSLDVQDQDLINQTMRNAVASSIQLGLLTGDGESFQPKKNAARQEIAVVLHRLMDIYYKPTTGFVKIEHIGEDTVQIGDISYKLTPALKALFTSENSEVLEGAAIRLVIKNNQITAITDLTVNLSENEGNGSPKILHGNGVEIGNLHISGSPLTISHLQITGQAELTGGTEAQPVVFENSTIPNLILLGPGTKVSIQQGTTVNDIILPPDTHITDAVTNYEQVKDQISKVNSAPPAAALGTNTGKSQGSKSSHSTPAVSSVDPVFVTIAVQESFALPRVLTVHLSDGTERERPVVWSDHNHVPLSESEIIPDSPGTLQFFGQVSGYTEEVSLTCQVENPLTLGWNDSDDDTQTIQASTNEVKGISLWVLRNPSVSLSPSDVHLVWQWDLPSGVTMKDVEILHSSLPILQKQNNCWVFNGSNLTASQRELVDYSIRFKKAGDYSITLYAVRY